MHAASLSYAEGKFMKSLVNILCTPKYLRQVLVIAALAIVGCSSPRNTWIQSPDEEPVGVDAAAGTYQVDFTPQAEIIFVMDNSDSMEHHIAEVTASIDKFVDAFKENNPTQ